MRVELQNEEHCRYLRVYHYYRNLILSGQMKSETKLPSIRKGASELQMSRTTMENAYMLLAAEGYIVSRPQSGYYVTDIAEKQEEGRKIASRHVRKQENPVVYDFATSNVDKESFRFELWRRYMKSAMRQDERLLSYGEPQGEQEFREVLSEYIQKTRSVICSPDQIVIGAGIQSLLHILCPLNHKKRTVFFRDSEFVQGMTVFEDHNYRIAGSAEEEIGMYYVSPSQMTRFGGVMPIQERLELVGRAEKEHFLIIEDDYNSEFKYFQKPVPSLQGLSGGRNVIYLGTFSKMLLPSIRISYMILPPELMETYEKRKNNLHIFDCCIVLLSEGVRKWRTVMNAQDSRSAWNRLLRYTMTRFINSAIGKRIAPLMRRTSRRIHLYGLWMRHRHIPTLKVQRRCSIRLRIISV